MTNDPLDELREGSLAPDPEFRRQAWLAAREAFFDDRRSGRSASSRWHLLTPLTSIAALLVACASLWLVLHRDPPLPVEPRGTEGLTNANLTDFFIQGRALFGERLVAVTVVDGRPDWQLSDAADDAQREREPYQQSVIAIARITDPKGALVQVVAIPGVPLNIPFAGNNLQIELLPTGNDQLLATGPSLVWSSGDRSSPLASAAIETLPR